MIVIAKATSLKWVHSISVGPITLQCCNHSCENRFDTHFCDCEVAIAVCEHEPLQPSKGSNPEDIK